MNFEVADKWICAVVFMGSGQGYCDRIVQRGVH